ncbi:uracil-DNA glycosylase [Pleionea sp. CnH1-48]|uniref:uracil-DNA glycosylase n=1 Tax=Pleionea sp. CnH1-48 TaxID=2954494 RepID=UPI00209819F5|nr:uracil-DNA glycosylase [Pleionea sp. CnH1-48]MCO7227207.1 uracil-DNA glycosylase [Pleionea sp. CnH1-48]
MNSPSPLSWADVLAEEKSKDYFVNIMEFVKSERSLGKTIYPPQNQIFSALKWTEYSDVKVVILGQDPYHGPNQANGLAFSVNKGIRLPPSLRNIYKEVAEDLAVPMPEHGDLTHWAKQGVILLNSALTVEAAQANSHQGKGWEIFTDKVIEQLSNAPQHLVFLLWGSHAQKKSALINQQQHTVLKAPHPSPLSAHRGFFGCKHFSLANQALKNNNQSEIDWQIPQ